VSFHSSFGRKEPTEGIDAMPPSLEQEPAVIVHARKNWLEILRRASHYFSERPAVASARRKICGDKKRALRLAETLSDAMQIRHWQHTRRLS
jgi:hypothetical protein